MLSHRSVLILGLLTLLLTGPLPAQSLFPKPVKVLGDPNFLGTAANPLMIDTQAANVVEGRELNFPEGIALDNSVSPPIVYIADTGNNRVLAFQYATQLKAGSYADLVLGQENRFTTIGGLLGVTTALKAPTGLAVDSSGNLYVADTGNNRVVRYPKPFSQTGYQIPDIVIGQTSYSGTSSNSGGVKATTLSLAPGGSFAGRTGLAIDASGNLWVADIGNNRVLQFPASVLQPGTGLAASLAVGQKDLVSSTAGTSRTGTSGMVAPTGIAFDSAGDLLVADGLARVLVYAPGVGLNASAIRILGVDPTQPANASSAIQIGGTSGNVEGVAAAGSNILVADNNNNRVLVFGPVSSWPAQSTQFSPSANQVIGQTSFTAATANGGNANAGAALLSAPTDMAADSTELFVADSANNRVLVFPISGGTISQTASRVIGQLDFPYDAPNLVEGKEFATVSGSALGGSAVLDLSATPPHLYVADTSNNRILGFANFSSAQTGQVADIVIGQPDLFHIVVNYPSGQASQPNAQSLNSPIGLAVDSAGNLYVADTGNGRILRFPAPFASGVTASESADLVIGQSNFTSVVTDATARTMAEPIGLAFTSAGANASGNSGYLVASDLSQNRVLLFPRPFSSGMSATIVLGQTGFNSGSAGTVLSTFTSPAGVAVDPQDRILVADAGNGRIEAYPPLASLSPSGTPASFALTIGLNQPVAIGMATGGDFWVADSSSAANHLLHYASIDNLPLANPPYSSEGTEPAISPRSAFVDTYGNVLATDGINRVLYFVPQVNVLNAANSIVGRSLAAGTIVSIYAAQSPNVISSGTVIGTTLPLSTNLSDTEVLVNGVPSALLYVSPGQINLPLSYSLPQSGIATIQVIRPSTGQIYAGGEISLASASPGLFVEGAQQSGPVAALNQDNSVNTATNPAARNSVIQIFGTGQGALMGAPPDGQASSGLVPTTGTLQIVLGTSGTNIISVPAANVTYSGLAPGFIGLWQINFTIPANAPTGTNVPITVFMNSISSSNTAVPTQVVTTISLK